MYDRLAPIRSHRRPNAERQRRTASMQRGFRRRRRTSRCGGQRRRSRPVDRSRDERCEAGAEATPAVPGAVSIDGRPRRRRAFVIPSESVSNDAEPATSATTKPIAMFTTVLITDAPRLRSARFGRAAPFGDGADLEHDVPRQVANEAGDEPDRAPRRKPSSLPHATRIRRHVSINTAYVASTDHARRGDHRPSDGFRSAVPRTARHCRRASCRRTTRTTVVTITCTASQALSRRAGDGGS